MTVSKKTLKEISMALHVAASAFRTPLGAMGWYEQGLFKTGGGWVKNGYLNYAADMVVLSEVAQGGKISRCKVPLKLVTPAAFEKVVRENEAYRKCIATHGEVLELKQALDKIAIVIHKHIEHLYVAVSDAYNPEVCCEELIVEVFTREHIDALNRVHMRVRIPLNAVSSQTFKTLFK